MKDHIIVHCSATEQDKDFGASDIDRWHRAKGWLGNGYHYVIKLDGTVESKANGARCRPVDKPGAHVGDCGPGWNRRSIGICLIGGLAPNTREPSENYTPEQFASLYELIGGLQAEFNVEDDNVLGHRDLIEQTGASPKSCPCFSIREWYFG